MKVLFTTNIPSPYRIDFFNELSKFCDLTVIIERKDAKHRNDEWLKCKEINFKVEYLKVIKFGNKIAVCPQITNYLKNNKFDIIVIGGYSTPTSMLAIQYLKNKKIDFILNSDGGIIKKDGSIKYKIKKYFISAATRCLSTGKHTSNYLSHYGADIKAIEEYPFSSIREKDILKNVMTSNEKDNLKEQLNINEKKVILSVGQFIHRKGFDVLIKSAKYLDKDIGIYIIGGKAPEEYEILKKENNAVNVHFIDFKQKQELEKYYKVADVFVFPTREDIWGLVVNEAMAYGLPVVTTDKCVAGLELIEEGKNGYIVPVEETKILASKINIILKNELLRKEMNINNINKIKEYTIEKMALKHLEIFEQILRKGQVDENKSK